MISRALRGKCPFIIMVRHGAPPLSARARRPIALHALDACDGLNGHLHRKPGRQLLLLLLLLRLATT